VTEELYIVSVLAFVGLFFIIIPRLSMPSMYLWDTIMMAIGGCLLLIGFYFEMGRKDGN
jgi:hypothetical protein